MRGKASVRLKRSRKPFVRQSTRLRMYWMHCALPASPLIQLRICQAVTDPSSIHALRCVRHETYRLDSGKLAFTAVLTSPMLLRALFLLENPHYIKLAAAWKDLFQDWCLMPIGVLSKQYAVSRYSGAKLPSWSTHFSEVLLLVSTTESKQAYAIGFEIFSKLKLQAQPPLLAGPNVRQVHADWSPAVEVARQRVFPHSIRASDYAHMWLNMKSRVSVCRTASAATSNLH